MSNQDQKLIFAPNFTQTPNVIYDYWMPRLSHAEFKVLSCICRQTFGFHKIADPLSYNQVEKKTGVSRKQVIESIKKLVELKLVEKIETINEFGDSNPNVYKINVMFIEQSDEGWCNDYTTQCNDYTRGGVTITPTKETPTKESVCTVSAAEAANEKIIFPGKGKALITMTEKGLIFALNKEGFSEEEISQALAKVRSMKKRPALSTTIDKYVAGIILKTRKQDEIDKAISRKVRKDKKDSPFDLPETKKDVGGKKARATPEEIEALMASYNKKKEQI